MSCCGKRAKYPSAMSMAKDLSSTIIQAMRHAMREGEILADEPLIRKRLQTCDRCDRKSGARCLECGCYISLKSAILVAECRLKKWPKS